MPGIDDFANVYFKCIMPHLSSVQICCNRLICKDLAHLRPLYESRHRKAEQLVEDNKYDMKWKRIYVWHPEAITKVEECELLLRHSLGRNNLFAKINIHRVIKLLRCTKARNNHIVLKWFEDNNLLGKLKGLSLNDTCECMQTIGRIGDLERFKRWKKEAIWETYGSIDLYYGYIDEAVEVFMNSKASTEEKLQLFYDLNTGSNASVYDTHGWKQIMECSDLKAVSAISSKKYNIKRLSQGVIMPATPAIMDHFIENTMLDVTDSEYTYMASTCGNLELLKHMAKIREKYTEWFPTEEYTVKCAIMQKQHECAEYLLETQFNGSRYDMANAITYGRVSTVKILHSRGIEIPADSLSKIYRTMSPSLQEETIEMYAYLLERGQEMNPQELTRAVQSGCEKITVYIHKLGIKGCTLTLSHVYFAKSQSIEFREYIDQHAGLDFKWGSYVDAYDQVTEFCPHPSAIE